MYANVYSTPMKTLSILFLCLLLASCQRSQVFTMSGTTYSIDRKFVHTIDAAGNYRRYKTSDPQGRAIVEMGRTARIANR